MSEKTILEVRINVEEGTATPPEKDTPQSAPQIPVSPSGESETSAPNYQNPEVSQPVDIIGDLAKTDKGIVKAVESPVSITAIPTPVSLFDSATQGFKTAKGSFYAYEGERTQRVKSAHEGHDPNDVGIKQASDVTRFVSTEDAQRIGMWNTLSAKRKRIIEEENALILTSFNEKEQRQGIDERIEIKSRTPQLGLSPIELWDKSDDGWWRANHPGNAITEFIDRRPRPHLWRTHRSRSGDGRSTL